MNIRPFIAIIIAIVGFSSCGDTDARPGRKVVIPDFNYPSSIVFESQLSDYNVYKGAPGNLVPSDDFYLLELSSVLYTDHAYKQRLIKVPAGKKVTRLEDGSLEFPDGTMLVKTFFYYHDERDTSLGKRVIESRLLIKENGIWNIAPYLWNDSQSDATLVLEGFDTDVEWISANGTGLKTRYHVPNENECITCHQSNSALSPIGPTLRNLNRTVEREGQFLNQINHLQAKSILRAVDLSKVQSIPDYTNGGASLEERGRAYLDMNCAHCHNPDGWEESSRIDLDLRYETSLDQSGIHLEKDKIIRVLGDGEMPFIGTTVIDHEGVQLVQEYLNSL